VNALKASGKCGGHPAVDVVPGKKRCQKCIDASRQRFIDVKAKGVCLRHPDRAGMNGTQRCHECRMNRYGYELSPGQYEQMHAAQGGKCAICRQPEKFRRQDLAVDHNHDTKKVRALLCMSCNTTLGNVKESIETLSAMIEYLKKHQQ